MPQPRRIAYRADGTCRASLLDREDMLPGIACLL